MSRSYLAVTRKFSIPLPSGEIQPKSHPPSRQKVYTSSRGYYVTLHSPSPSVVDSKFDKISLSRESFAARQSAVRRPCSLSLRPRRRSTKYIANDSFVRIHCFFRRMFAFRHSFDECSTSEENMQNISTSMSRRSNTYISVNQNL